MTQDAGSDASVPPGEERQAPIPHREGRQAPIPHREGRHAPTPHEDARDAQLVARCRAGDHQAWRALVERHAPLVHGILRGPFRLPAHDAEDLFQEVFTRLYVNLDAVRDEGAIRGWIAQVTRRVALDWLRRAAREQPAGKQLDERSFEEAMPAVEEALSVQAALERLPPPQRDILERFFLRDQSYHTIATELGIPAGTIASRISRALAALRDEYEPPGRSPGAGTSTPI